MSQTPQSHRNPYQPIAPATPTPGVDIPSLLPQELTDLEIEFDGRADDDDLEELLNLTSTAGRNWLLLFPIIFGALIVLMNASWPWVMCAVGFALFFLVLVSLLSRSYRRAVFLAYNARWNQPLKGTIDSDGYRNHCGGASAVVRWSYHCNAFHSDSIVAFQSAAQSQVYRIFPRNAVGTAEQWELLCSIAARIHCSDQQTQICVARVTRARNMMTDKDRIRILRVPDDAIAFAGAITHHDLKHLLTSPAQKRLAIRSYWYAGLAAVGLSAIIAGLAGFALRGVDRDVGPTPTFVIVVTLVVLVGAAWLWLKRRGQTTSNQVFFELKGFVDQVGVMFDYPFAARRMPWEETVLAECDDDRIVLRDGQYDETVLLRSDMFQTSGQWQRCCALANQHAMVRGVVIDE